jgi:hypothetical protein
MYITSLTAEAEEEATKDQQILNRTGAGDLPSRVALRARPTQPLNFESILRYADFPDLNRCKATMEEYRKDFDEIQRVLRWLKKKEVDQIVKLKVLDRLRAPHTDEIIAESVNDFKIETLNWRKLDMYLANLDKAPKADSPYLKKLYLYSSGNQAVIDHWMSGKGKGGLRDLLQVRAYQMHF